MSAMDICYEPDALIGICCPPPDAVVNIRLVREPTNTAPKDTDKKRLNNLGLKMFDGDLSW